MDEHANHTIRGYEVRERVGVGSFGAVYRAFQPSIGREVAIKVIGAQHARHQDFVRRFEVEAQLVARLEHPHIVPLYDYWREPDGAYLVMRWLPSSLRRAMNRSPWSPEAAARLLNQVAGALTVAHRDQVVHCDIKPENILLDEDENAYLADFGIAKMLSMRQSSEEDFAESPAYLSPEQIRNESTSPRTDIYSLGYVLYELLTGESAFPDAKTPMAYAQKHLNKPLPALTAHHKYVPAALDEVLQTATAKDPAQRYASAQRFAAAFRAAMPVTLPRILGQPLADPLSERELDVLRWMVKGLTNEQIGEKLVLSLGTVRWYVKQIYSKLDVHSRHQAMERAVQLELTAERPARAEPPSVPDSIPVAARKAVTVSASEPTNPYKGLRAFQAADTEDFFGRATLIEQVLNRLSEKGDAGRFLAIVGPSGCGKSSLVKAGLIPALRRGALLGSSQPFIAEMLPATHPFEELEAALLRVAVNPLPGLLEQLRDDRRGLVRAAKSVLPGDPNTELILIIDQFEELFTLVDDESIRVHFIDNLMSAASDPRGRVRIVLTMRADFYDRPLLYPHLAELVRSHTELVLPLSARELEQAIAGPAERVGVRLESGLVTTIVNDVAEQPGALPLLQYGLTELFERREGVVLTVDGYKASGGVLGALPRRAEELYAGLDSDSQAAVRQLFLRMVTLGEGTEDTRRRALQSEVLSVGPDPSLMEDVITTFSQYRLLTLDRDHITRGPTVEVAHEAMIQRWERLRGWLTDSREDLRLLRLLDQAAAEWQRAEEDPSYLLTGARLAQYETWATDTEVALTPAERAFLEASIARRAAETQAEVERQAREQRLERRSQAFLRGLVGIFALAAVVAAVLGVSAASSAREASRERDAAQAARATSEASFARAEQQRLYLTANEAMDRGEGGNVGLALALRSLQYGYTTGAEAALLRASRQGTFMLELTGFNFDVFGTRYSPDGSLIAASSEGGTRIYNAQTGEELHFLPEEAAIVSHVEFSSDGASLLTIAQTGIARVYDTTTWLETDAFEVEKSVNLVSLSNDGSRVIIGGENLEVWEAGTWERLAQYERSIDEETYRLAVLYGAKNIERFITRLDSRVIVQDATSGETLCAPLDADVPIDTTVWWSEQEPLLMIAPADPIDGAYRAYVYNYDTCSPLSNFTEPDYRIWNARYDPVHERIVTINSNSEVVQWQLSTGYELARYSVPINAYDMDISPDGTRLILADVPAARVVNLAFPAQPTFITTELSDTEFPRFAPDGESVYIGGFGRGGHYTLEAGAPAIRLYEQAMRVFAISPDGRYIGSALELVGTEDHPLLWIDAATGDTVRTFDGFTQLANVVDISPDGTRIAGGSFDLTARIWDTATGEALHVLEGHEGGVSSVSFSPDGARLATSSTDQTVRVWDTATGELIRTIDVGGPVVFVSYSPDGTLIGAASGDGFAHLYDAVTGRERFRLVGHTDIVSAITFSPDSRMAVTTGFDGTVRVWDTYTGALLRTLTNGSGNDLYYAEFSPDGRIVIAGGEFDNRVSLYTVDLDAAIAAMCAQPLLDLSADQRAQYGITDSGPVCPLK